MGKMGVTTASRYGTFLCSEENVLELDDGNDCTALYINTTDSLSSDLQIYLPLCELSFHFSDGVSGSTKVNFDKSNLVFLWLLMFLVSYQYDPSGSTKCLGLGTTDVQH